MTCNPGISKAVKNRAHSSGTDTSNLDSRTSPGNPSVENILSFRSGKRAQSILSKGTAAFKNWRKHLRFLAATALTSAAILYGPEVSAAVGPGVISSDAGQFIQVLDGIDWAQIWQTFSSFFSGFTIAVVLIQAWIIRKMSLFGAIVHVIKHMTWDEIVALIEAIELAVRQYRKRIAEKVESEEQIAGDEPVSQDHILSESDQGGASASFYPAQTEYQLSIFSASRKGKVRKENMDAVQILRCAPNEGLAVVADGAGGVPNSAIIANKVAENICDAFLRRLAARLPGQSETDCIEAAISEVRKQAIDEEWEGITTLVFCYVKDSWLYYASIGDGAISLLWPDDNVSQLLVPHHHDGKDHILSAFVGQRCTVASRTGAVRLEPGTIIWVMSDGVSGIIDWNEVVANRIALTEAMRQGGDSDKVAGDILLQLEQARDLETDALIHSDNMTLVLALLDEVNDKSSPKGSEASDGGDAHG